MIMKKLILLFSLVCGLVMSGCNSFLDVNTNPNYPETAAPSAILPGIISNGSQQYFLSVNQSGYYVQHLGGRTINNAKDQFFLTNLASPFNDTYFRTTGNIKPLIEAATKEGSPYYVGAGKTLMALWIAHLTDCHGDIPYSDAFNAAANYTPKYDTQEQIYATVQKLLDEALVEFNKPASSNLRPLSDRDADLFFAGDVSKWIKLVYSLRARQLNHLSKKSSYSAQAVLAAIDNGIKANSDDAQLQFNITQVALTNPWAPARANVNTATFGRYFINMLNGTTLGGGIDPRLQIIAPGNRGGVINGSGEATTPSPNRTDFYGVYLTTKVPPEVPDTSGWYARPAGVQLVFTNAEVRFIEAEAAFRSGDKGRAYTAYTAGITAHLVKLGVAAAAQTAYLASAAVAKDASSLTLKNIMQQKYIAMFLHPETWVDMRRMDFSADIYTNFQQPTNPNSAMKGQFPRRFLPGTTENLYNPVNANKEVAGAADYIGLIPVWWDKP